MSAHFETRARTAYGAALPDWVLALAKEADRTTAVAAGKKCGFGGSTVSQICSATYGAQDWSGIEGRVRGALMNEEVDCPVLGEIGRDQCLDEQKKRFVGSSQQRTRLFHTCPVCPNSRMKKEAANV